MSNWNSYRYPKHQYPWRGPPRPPNHGNWYDSWQGNYPQHHVHDQHSNRQWNSASSHLAFGNSVTEPVHPFCHQTDPAPGVPSTFRNNAISNQVVQNTAHSTSVEPEDPLLRIVDSVLAVQATPNPSGCEQVNDVETTSVAESKKGTEIASDMDVAKFQPYGGHSDDEIDEKSMDGKSDYIDEPADSSVKENGSPSQYDENSCDPGNELSVSKDLNDRHVSDDPVDEQPVSDDPDDEQPVSDDSDHEQDPDEAELKNSDNDEAELKNSDDEAITGEHGDGEHNSIDSDTEENYVETDDVKLLSVGSVQDQPSMSEDFQIEPETDDSISQQSGKDDPDEQLLDEGHQEMETDSQTTIDNELFGEMSDEPEDETNLDDEGDDPTGDGRNAVEGEKMDVSDAEDEGNGEDEEEDGELVDEEMADEDTTGKDDVDDDTTSNDYVDEATTNVTVKSEVASVTEDQFYDGDMDSEGGRSTSLVHDGDNVPAFVFESVELTEEMTAEFGDLLTASVGAADADVSEAISSIISSIEHSSEGFQKITCVKRKRPPRKGSLTKKKKVPTTTLR